LLIETGIYRRGGVSILECQGNILLSRSGSDGEIIAPLARGYELTHTESIMVDNEPIRKIHRPPPLPVADRGQIYAKSAYHVSHAEKLCR
jgi:hypothetical protein